MSRKPLPSLIMDADVLVDYVHCDSSIIPLISTHVGRIHVATPVFREVKEITEGDCGELGITLVEPDIEQVIHATEARGPLSMQDHLCVLLAKEQHWICVTNDRPLRRECESQGVPLIWGVELICQFVEARGFSPENAKDFIL